MRKNYLVQQAANDMRIIDESLAIMARTADLEVFLSRYELTMRCALSLKQAKEAGIAVTLNDDFSYLLTEAKGYALKDVLYRSFNKEVAEINALKTKAGKLNRVEKYKQKLQKYEEEFEFVADESYSDVMLRLDIIKRNIEAEKQIESVSNVPVSTALPPAFSRIPSPGIYVPPTNTQPYTAAAKPRSSFVPIFAGVSVIFLVVVLLLFGNLAKGKSNGGSSSSIGNSLSPNGGNSSDEETKETLYNIGDTVYIDDWEITVSSVEVTDKISNKTYGTLETFFSPEEGNKYIVFDVTIKNLSTDSSTFLPIAAIGDYVKVKIQYGEYDFSSTNLIGHSDELHQTGLNPLSTKTGILAFDIAEEVVNDFDALNLVFYTKKESRVFLMEEAQSEIETEL